MTTTTTYQPDSSRVVDQSASPDDDTVAIHRRTIDKILIGFGVVAALAFLVAGSLLLWGNRFSSDYVGDELSSQNISFPAAAALEDQGRGDLVEVRR